MAEWLKALVLKTRDGNIRRFESCPFRQDKKKPRRGYFLILETLRVIFLAYFNFIWSNIESRSGGGVAREDSSSDDIFNSFLHDAAHRAGTHFRVITFVY